MAFHRFTGIRLANRNESPTRGQVANRKVFDLTKSIKQCFTFVPIGTNVKFYIQN